MEGCNAWEESGVSDWQVGDLAVCVHAGRLPHIKGADVTDRIREGGVYRVEGAWVDTYDYVPVLLLEGVRSVDDLARGALAAERFRKIRPDEHKACEPEFVTLLKRNRVSA